jgi:hypothetical protein
VRHVSSVPHVEEYPGETWDEEAHRFVERRVVLDTPNDAVGVAERRPERRVRRAVQVLD